MALLKVLEGVCELYDIQQNKTTHKCLHKYLLPQVKLQRLTSADISSILKESVIGNTTNFDHLSLFEEEEDEGFPFLGFGEYGEPTIQFPTLTRSLSKGSRNSSKRNLNLIPKVTVNEGPPKERSVMHCKNSFEKCKPVGLPITTPHSQKDSLPVCTDSISTVLRGSSFITSTLEVGNESDMTDQLQIKNEINDSDFDDHDIIIENEDFDYAYSVNERILSPSSRELHGNISTSQICNSGDIVNENCGLFSENRESVVFREHSGQANGLSRSNNLAELTTVLLELNNRNKEFDKKLAKLKQAYEAKVSKILQEKTANEKKIQDTLKKIQSWQNKLVKTCVNTSTPKAEILSGTSTVVKDNKKGLKRSASARKKTEKVFKKDSVSSHSKFVPKDNNCHDPEPIMNIDSLVKDILECDDSMSVENIDAEIVSLSELYSGKNNSLSDLESLPETFENELSKFKKVKRSQGKNPDADLVKKVSHLKPVVCLNDIYSPKKESLKNIKCGSYIIVKLSSKKSVKYFCAVVRNKNPSGDYEVQYLERKGKNEFIFPEKEVVYKIEDGDIVQLLQDPTVNMKGLRLYYSFPGNNLDRFKSLT
ncbi:uncharacterized protein [Palaemon carinicauda]|uniref:uncharacterized protein n=1 Tax=Palaemon carinicauda TaxID=392227 RepID=UPI0035B58FA8